MNENFNRLIEKNNKSLYRISFETGIPYTILNELKNKKKNINNINVETVYKLCLYFSCDMKDILNPFFLIKNAKGKYMGIKYSWIETNDTIELHILDDDKSIILLTLKNTFENAYSSYNNSVVKVAISYYLESKKEDELLKR